MNKWADMWESLVAGGMDPDAATARVREAQAAEQAPAPNLTAPGADNRPQALRQIQETYRELPRPKLSPGTAALLGMNQVARGYTGGLSDRAIAGVASLAPGVSYGDARRKIDEGNRQFADEFPATNIALNVGGGFLPGPSVLGKAAGAAARLIPKAGAGAGALARGASAVGRGAAGGAAAGALGAVGYQDGEADTSLRETTRNAAIGATAGGVLGGAAVPVAATARRVGGSLADVTGLRQLRAGSVPAGQVPRTPGTGSLLQRAGDWAEGRLIPTQASRRADQKIADAITRGGQDDLATTAANLRYDNVMSGNEAAVADLGGDFGMRLARGAKTKSVEASDALGQTFDGRDARLLTNLRRDVQQTVAGPVNTVQAGRALRETAQRGSQPLYAAAEPQAVPLSTASRAVLLDRDPRGVFRAAHRIARDMAQEAGEAPIPPLFARMEDGSWALTRDQLEVREIDAMKKGIQQLVEVGTKSGKTLSRKRAKDMLENLQTLVADADAAVPEYAAAREAFAAPTRQAEAMATAMRGAPARGRGMPATPSFAQGAPDELADVVSGMTPDQRDFYDIGKGAGIYRQASKDARSALRLMNKDDFAQRLRATTQPRDAARADELLEAAGVRLAQGKRAGQIMSGSPTADKLQDALSAALPGKSGQAAYAAGRAALDLIMGRSLGGLQSQTANEVGKRMALQGPLAEDYLQHLLRSQAYDASRAASGAATRRGSVGALLGLSRQDP